MRIEDLIRPNIRALKPYRSARHDFTSGILLDANENSFGSVLQLDGLELNRYPDPFQVPLRAKLAHLHGVGVENAFVGVGSDEVIDLLLRIFCEPTRDSIVIVEPTYGMYRVAADINNIRVRTSLLTDDFQIDIASVRDESRNNTKIIFCCSPNNPTGNVLRHEDILSICRHTPAIVVVDEAYHDFAGSESLIRSVASTPNLVVLRTLSKAWGLAGIRLGYCVASPVIISYLMKVKAPYNINVLTSHEALKALEDVDRVRRTASAVVQERERLAQALKEIPYVTKVFPSEANFVLIRCTRATLVYRRLAEQGIIVRDRTSEPKLQDCLRITVGTPTQDEQLIEAMRGLRV